MLKSELRGAELVARKVVRYRPLKPRIWGFGMFFTLLLGDHKTLSKFRETLAGVINSTRFIKVQ